MGKRSEETRQAILLAATKLFSKKGYEAVTMREIAKEAGCSHTTIYLYFKDKISLLQQLSMPSLQHLYQQLKEISSDESIASAEKLKAMSRQYLSFCLENQNMYSVFINARSGRVDEENPSLEVNQIRNMIFKELINAVSECLEIKDSETALAYTRIYYYSLNGILTTYAYMHESVEELMERLTPTFDLMAETFILGCIEKMKKGES
ncbi:AcrR family transcriptional regulator [Cytobacillus horneckiae]|uniref:TetR/AcrR family transcriptional regulator n=1 Tax=Cytobacillus horneckiae TaxID=549687 RepID=A0A2N0ZMN8_9BACI|nr:TetR/AcrR family transcriptional regulator [Cytobacillus horneckiae]MBN6886297.1 TetR/AcrR family transcriptional regulator [Cytobacillus horneckiae]MEC1159132.1 TetR/AcrR family transcriptional regulator [Cytobacillus horneckiae]MED2938824.1 TetR/AcrR family transcriptional regulator [Cytobacillus horneckiae]PKG30763.1 TetR/AcrR family transcriptional regulator [Cytobacillus horneckiae]